METGGDTRQRKLHQTSTLTEQGHGSTHNNHLEAHPSTMGSNPAHPLSSSSSSQNPFLVPSDATNNAVEGSLNNGSSRTNPASSLGETDHSSSGDMLGLHSPFSPPAYESSQGDLLHDQQTETNNKVPVGAFESQNPFQVTEQGHQGMDSSGLGASFSPALESSNQEHIDASVNDANKPQGDTKAPSDDDIPITSMHKHEHSDDVVAEQHLAPVSPGSNLEYGTNKGPEIQNPPVQVMERPNESGASSQYVFPSHVFARNNTNAPVEWSTASNESLFSIYMGNMSFSTNELACFKSCELDKPGDVHMHDQPNASPSHQPLTPVNKFNDISQRTAELHEEGSKVTEAKAAETMREVIMESSKTNENVGKREDKNSNSQRQPDGSTNSYAFQT